MKTLFVKEEIRYTGKELRSHFSYSRFDLLGDSLVAFCGGCDVRTADLVDLADAKEEAVIYSESMLHFIGEFFDHDLERTVLKQRLLVAIVKDEITELSGSSLVRTGDDIFDGDAKLSVSIATLTPVSGIIHTGINISSQNTPVKARGLSDYGIEATTFAEKILRLFAQEMDGVRSARCKVRGVE